MQFPFLSPDVPNYVTFAMAGAIIGHEISHGFDDQGLALIPSSPLPATAPAPFKGAQYDQNGMLHNWWDKETKDKFDVRLRT